MSVITDLFKGNLIDGMKQKYVGSIIRGGLIAVGAVTAKDVDDGQITQLAGALMAIASIAWSMYEKRTAREKLVTTLAVANVTEDHVKALIANPDIPNPSVNTPANVVPLAPTLKDAA